MPPDISAPALHRKLLDEVRDPNWSSNVESQLAGFFGQDHPDLGQVAMADLQCRASLCELRGYARSATNGAEGTNQWQQAIEAMRHEPWWTTYGLGEPSNLFTVAADGRPMFVTFLRRNRAP